MTVEQLSAHHGRRVTCYINDTYIPDAIVFYSRSQRDVFLLQNNLSGAPMSNSDILDARREWPEYAYSWSCGGIGNNVNENITQINSYEYTALKKSKEIKKEVIKVGDKYLDKEGEEFTVVKYIPYSGMLFLSNKEGKLCKMFKSTELEMYLSSEKKFKPLAHDHKLNFYYEDLFEQMKFIKPKVRKFQLLRQGGLYYKFDESQGVVGGYRRATREEIINCERELGLSDAEIGSILVRVQEVAEAVDRESARQASRTATSGTSISPFTYSYWTDTPTSVGTTEAATTATPTHEAPTTWVPPVDRDTAIARGERIERFTNRLFIRRGSVGVLNDTGTTEHLRTVEEAQEDFELFEEDDEI